MAETVDAKIGLATSATPSEERALEARIRQVVREESRGLEAHVRSIVREELDAWEKSLQLRVRASMGWPAHMEKK